MAFAGFLTVPAWGGPLEEETSELLRRFPAAGPDEQEKILHRLGEIGPEARAAIPLLIRLLSSEDLSSSAVHALAGLQGESAEIVARHINDGKLEFNLDLWIYESIQIYDAAPLIPLAATRLKHNDVSMRQKAASELGDVPFWPLTAVPALFDALQDEDRSVRREAIFSLVAYGAAANDTLPSLAKLARSDPSPYVRKEALRTLARLDVTGEIAIPTLAAALGDNGREVNMSAWGDEPVSLVAGEELSQIAPRAEKAVPTVLALLTNENKWHSTYQFRNVTCVLSWHPDQARTAIPFLREQMQGELQPDGSGLQIAEDWAGKGTYFESMMVRASGAAVLAAIDSHDDAAIQVLIATLQDKRWDSWGRYNLGGFFGPRPEPRMIAAEALGRLGERARASIPVLRQILDGRDRTVRNVLFGKVAWALAQLDPADQECVSLIDDYLESPRYWSSPFYREDFGRIAEVLGERVRVLVPQLVSRSGSTDPDERRFCTNLLVHAGGDAIGKLVQSIFAIDDEGFSFTDRLVLRELGRNAEPAIANLLDCLKSADHRIRAEAAWLLGEIEGHDAESVPALTAALRDTRILVRARAANALGRIGVGAAPATEELRMRLKDDSPWVRSEAETALARIAQKPD